jgi:alpha-tubulin suppressor-like RCC1 family protein
MVPLRSFLWCLLASGVLVLPIQSSAAESDQAAATGADVVREFERSFDTTKSDLARPIRELTDRSRDILVQQIAEYGKSGNVNATLAASEALKSLTSDFALTHSNDPAVETWRTTYLAERSKALQKLAPRVRAMLEDYTQKLKTLTESLVRQGYTDEALIVAERAEALRKWMDEHPPDHPYSDDALLCLLRTGAPALTSVVAWGRNDQGQAKVPEGLFGVVAVDGGLYHSLALKSDGTVAAWGGNADGQTNVPGGLGGVVAIAAGEKHNLALKANGAVIAWGYNKEKQCEVPAGLSHVKAISSQTWHSLALKTDGTVVAWGRNNHGESAVPADLTGVIQICAGSDHNLALKSDGTVVAWGLNSDGQCDVPAGLRDVVAIAAGHFHSLALTAGGNIVGWGLNNYGQLNAPRGLNHVRAIAAQGWHSAALTWDGKVEVWGMKAQGQTNVPKDLSGSRVMRSGTYHLLAIFPMKP